MTTRLKLDLPIGKIELEGEESFVRELYGEFKSQLAMRDRGAADTREELYELIGDARISGAWNEYQRAYALYQRALEECPKGIESSVLADIFEGMEDMERAIEETGHKLPELQTAVQADPDDAEKRFRLALALSRVGQEKEAFAEYEAALRNPADLCQDCFRDLWNNIGWYYYRRGRYQEALKWFDQFCKVADVQEKLGHGDARLGLENKVLAYCALKMEREAEATANEYVRRYGRFRWPERRALAKLKIDADAMYVERCQSDKESR